MYASVNENSAQEVAWTQASLSRSGANMTRLNRRHKASGLHLGLYQEVGNLFEVNTNRLDLK